MSARWQAKERGHQPKSIDWIGIVCQVFLITMIILICLSFIGSGIKSKEQLAKENTIVCEAQGGKLIIADPPICIAKQVTLPMNEPSS